MKELQEDHLQEIVSANDVVFVQYGATWCGNCKIMKPKFKRAAEQHTNAVFYYVDAEKFPKSRTLATVNNLPTFAVFKHGELLNQVQTNKADVLNQFIDEATTN